MQDLKIAFIAMNSVHDFEKNWAFMRNSLAQAVAEGCQWLVGPEMFLGISDAAFSEKAYRFYQDEVLPYLADFAKAQGLILIPGSVATPDGRGKFLNCLDIIGRDGKVVGSYNKRFLFQLDAKQANTIYDETRLYNAGGGLLTLEIDNWKVGFAICYDLRFSSHFNAMIREAGLLDLLIVPSAFTFQTGKDHWEVLLRARAIEYQCFVVAPNQVGEHGEGKKSFGHSMALDPWGRVLLDLGETFTGYGVVTLNKSLLHESRTRLTAASTLLRSLRDRS